MEHVQRLSLETKRNKGFAFRNLKGTGHGTKDLAHKTIIRPQLEYYSSACDPYTQELIDELEAI
jgi:hypothetical protein